MLRALGSAETGMTAMQQAMDTIANNLANMDTTGYKGQNVDFADLVYQGGGPSGYPLATTGGNVQLGTGSQVAAVDQDLSQGNLVQTKKPWDLAVNGSGYFAVNGPGNKPMYTRDGRFSLNSQGQVVTSAGYALVPPITVPLGTSDVVVGADGQVNATLADGTQSQIGSVKVYTFSNPEGLSPMGGNLYQASGASGQATARTPGSGGAGSVAQGSLEQSNVSLISQMTDLMLVERAYEFNSKAAQTADAMWSTANQMYQE